MAERRMFTQKITDSDAFLDMPLSTQCLYFHLNMKADDDGFVNSPKKIQRMLGASDDDLKLLLAKRFILGFETGVIVIKHWRMHNLLRKDRYNPTQYQEEYRRLCVKENGAYTEHGNLLATTWQPDGNQMATQVRIDKESIGKDRLEEKPKAKRFVAPTVEEVSEYITEKGLNIDAERFVDFYQSKGWMVGKSPMKDWKAAARGWDQRERKSKDEEAKWFDPE